MEINIICSHTQTHIHRKFSEYSTKAIQSEIKIEKSHCVHNLFLKLMNLTNEKFKWKEIKGKNF